MRRTICILIQVSEYSGKEAWDAANQLASECNEALERIGCTSWRSAFPFVTNQDLIRTLNAPLLELEDKAVITKGGEI